MSSGKSGNGKNALITGCDIVTKKILKKKSIFDGEVNDALFLRFREAKSRTKSAKQKQC